MAGVTFSKKILESLVGKKLSIEQWEEKLMLLGFGFEGALGDSITVEVFPNRPDCLSEQGLARAMRGFLGIGVKKLPVASPSIYELHIDKSVEKVRPFTSCAVVTGLKFDDAMIKNIIQFQEKLHMTFCRNRKKAAIGIYPLEHIVWPIKYLARKPGDIKFQPLESGKIMSAREILEHHPTGKAFASLLEGKEKYPLFVDAKEDILSLPPIINSEKVGRVTTQTKDVFVECSGFDQRTLNQLLAIIVTALADAGGKVHQVTLRYGAKKVVTPSLASTVISFDVQEANRILGSKFTDADCKRLLPRMGYELKGKQVLVPAYRSDVLHSRDVIEDIAIAAGYDSIVPEIPRVATVASEAPLFVFQRKIAGLLIGLGLLETNTFHLTSKEGQTVSMLHELKVVELFNSLNKEYDSLRSWMLPSLMEVLRNNRNHEYPQKLFGIGTVINLDASTETGARETRKLCVVASHSKADYTEMRQIVEYLLDKVGVAYSVSEENHGSFIPGRTAAIIVDKKPIALVGEVHPQVLRNWELEMPVVALELDLELLFSFVKN